MIEALPRFQFWVRRSHGDGAVFSIRFEVEEGRGLLRVARPGVLVDPPARESGFEERLTPAQVRASRFLHVWDGGRKRQGYVLSRLTDDVLGELARGSWEQMKVVSDGGFCWLVPGVPEELPEVEPEPPTVSGLAPLALPDEDLEPVTVTDDPPSPSQDLSQDLSKGPPPDGLPAGFEVEDADTDAVEPQVALAELEEAGEAQLLTEEVSRTSSPPLSVDGSAFAPFGRATTLVRHLRREKLRDRQRIAELTAEVERLRGAQDVGRADAAPQRPAALKPLPE